MIRKAVLLLVSALLLAVATCAAQSLVINEIGFDLPQGVEFVEILNASNTTIDLISCALADARGQWVPVTTTTRILAPGAFIVLTGSHAKLKAAYGEVEALEVLPWPALNNDGDAVVLRLGKSVIDSLYYRSSWGGSDVSLERRDPARPSTDPANWGSSTDRASATPGRQNSLYAPDRTTPHVVQAEETSRGEITLTFDEAVRATGALVTMDGAAPIEVPITSGNTLIARFPGIHEALRVRNVADLSGNILADTSVTVARLAPEGAVVINEIMYEPLADAYDQKPDGAEYVELLNVQNEPIGATDWYVTTRPTETGKVDTLRVRVGPQAIAPGGFLVLYATGRSILNNDGDEITLHRADGTVIDRVTYDSDWHNPVVRSARGISLERISPDVSSSDPANWTSCVDPDGGTPGKSNSVRLAVTGEVPVSGIQAVPSPFSPDHDGLDDVTVITYVLRALPLAIRARIFDAGGRLVRTLAGIELSAQEGSLAWDGMDDRGSPLPIGIYIVLLEATASGGAREAYRTTVVLARPL